MSLRSSWYSLEYLTYPSPEVAHIEPVSIRATRAQCHEMVSRQLMGLLRGVSLLYFYRDGDMTFAMAMMLVGVVRL